MATFYEVFAQIELRQFLYCFDSCRPKLIAIQMMLILEAYIHPHLKLLRLERLRI